MSSINRSRHTAVSELAEDDPFAELTRIVGNDPRVRDEDADPFAANDALGLDLEQELLGSLRRAAPTLQADNAYEAGTIDPVETFAAEPAQYLSDAMDAEFEAAFNDAWQDERADADAGELATGQPGEPVIAEAPTDLGVEPTVDAQVQTEAGLDNDLHLFDRIAAELRESAFAPASRPQPQASHAPSASADAAPAYRWPRAWSHAVATTNLSGSTRMAAGTDDHLEPVSDAEPVENVDATSATVTSEIEEDGAFFAEGEIAAETTSEDEGRNGEAGLSEDDWFAADLEASLASDAPASDDAQAETEFSAFEQEQAAELSRDIERAFDDERAGADSDREATADIATEAAIPPDQQEAPLPSFSMARAAFSSWTPESDLPVEEVEERSDTQAPFEEALEQAFESNVEDASDDVFAPQIETVEIEDRAVHVSDDLDIPEPETLTEPAAPLDEFDDLAAELAGAFGDMSDETVAERVQPAQAEQTVWGAMPAQTGAAAAAAPQDEASRFTLEDGPYDFGTDNASAYAASFEPSGREDFGAWAGGLEEEDTVVAAPTGHASRRFGGLGRRGVVGAAVLVGVVLLGGVSVFALSAGGGGLGQPAVVTASDEPYKVRPKNPGGAKVDTENNEVYQRASGNAADVPAQKTLLTSAEQPIDLSKQVIDASAVEPMSDDGAEEAMDDVVKSQDRLGASAADVPADAQPSLTVQAHRVKTFVVRPDGTLVPRENPEPETEVATASPQNDADATDDGVETNGPAPAVAEKPAAKPAQKPTPVKVASTEPAAKAAPKPALAPAATQAAASDWSVQIASQPTAEAAQISYQRMAQRYGDALAGRGVNIVKAEVSGKGTYYRVRIPSTSKDDAIALCTKLKAAGGSCFVSK